MRRRSLDAALVAGLLALGCAGAWPFAKPVMGAAAAGAARRPGRPGGTPPPRGAFVAIVVPLAAFTAAAQMLISTYGRSYREAQTYVSYLATVVSFVRPLVVMFTGAREAPWQAAVPVLGQLMALQRVLRGDGLAGWDALVPAAVSLTLAVAAVAAVAKLLRDERIVFGRS